MLYKRDCLLEGCKEANASKDENSSPGKNSRPEPVQSLKRADWQKIKGILPPPWEDKGCWLRDKKTLQILRLKFLKFHLGKQKDDILEDKFKGNKFEREQKQTGCFYERN